MYFEIEEHDIEVLLDQLSNNEGASDDELVKHLFNQTRFPLGVLRKVVKGERPRFRLDPMRDKTDVNWTKYKIRII